jgi:hypothetical protein
MARLALEINGCKQTVDADPEMPLLWVLRDLLNMTGTNMVAASGCVEPALFTSTAQQPAPARHPWQPRQASESSPSKALPKMACIRYRKPGSLNKFRNAVTANRDRSCPRLRCSLRNLIPPTPISTKPWPVISVVAPPTSAFATPSTALPRRGTREHETQPCTDRKQDHHFAPHLPRNLRSRRRSPCGRPHASRPSSPALFGCVS